MVLEGPKEIKNAINALVMRNEELGVWGRGNDKEKNKLCEEWNQIMRGKRIMSTAATTAGELRQLL